MTALAHFEAIAAEVRVEWFGEPMEFGGRYGVNLCVDTPHLETGRRRWGVIVPSIEDMAGTVETLADWAAGVSDLWLPQERAT